MPLTLPAGGYLAGCRGVAPVLGTVVAAGMPLGQFGYGQAHWVTVPPTDSQKVHRNDLLWETMQEPDPMAPVLCEITETLLRSNSVWQVGNLSVVYPRPSPASGLPVQWCGPYVNNWNAQLTAHLLGHARGGGPVEIPVNGPVNQLENLPVLRFSGYKSATD